MSNDYVAKVVLRTPLPRSSRQRGQGMVGSAVASIVPDGVTDHAQLSGRYDPDAHPLNAITGLAEFKGLFDSMFERVNLGTDAVPVYAIKAKLDLFSVGGITAYGEGQGGGGGGEGNYTYWMQDPTDGRTHATLRAVLTGGTATKDGDVSLNGHTHAYSDISGRPNLSAVATSGSYNDLSNKPQSVKNPYSLTFGNKTYDGSSAKTITASDLGALTAHQSLANYYTKGEVDTALIGKANVSHGHSISDVTGLQTALDGKQAAGNYALQGAANNLIYAGNEFNFIPSGYSAYVYINYRTAGGYDGNIPDYVFCDGSGHALFIMSDISSNAANGNTAYCWGNHASQGYLTASVAASTYHPKNGSVELGFAAEKITLANNPDNNWNFASNENAIRKLYCEIQATGAPSNYCAGISIISQNCGFQIVNNYSNQNNLKFRVNNDTWGDWKEIYHSGNLTNLSQLTDNLGSNPVHTHSQYLASAVAATTYHPKGGSTALALSASSLTLAGAISGLTNINSKLTFSSDSIYSAVPFTAFGAAHFETKLTGSSIYFNQPTREGGWVSRIGYQQGGTRIGMLGGANVSTAGVTSYFYGGATDSTCAINVNGSNGNVGIGTTSAAQKLDIVGKLRLRSASDTSKYIDLEINSNGNLKINGNVVATGGFTAYQSN